jgi:tRNA dimethylallyltransferase
MSADAVLIAGPTASGKSAAALALAEAIGGTLINTDSMQVYRELSILTARPDESDTARAPHLLYGHASVTERYDVARYAMDAANALAEARASARIPIFVGGTGLYFGALTQGIPDMPKVPAAIHEAARARREQLGAEAFFAEFSARDPETSSRLRASDTQRVLRAFEVIEATGRSLAEWQTGKNIAVLEGLVLARFVLAPPRPTLHRRIEARFDTMLEAGAMEEAARLADIDPSLPSAKILGLRELNAVCAGRMSLEEARAAAVAATRQYAKRQLTWFRHRMTDWRWIESDDANNIVTNRLHGVA